ncbi:protein of unknown function [Candidatus Promineifilum breve]|uniref:Uncharacterized protein n=1 Tax=Candidatus Promineifilum breve TaxID=1806508 RepID=A0A160T822_9CHLR|nr:protein of unknown function [Candidatus Promineifilum breve]
MQPDYSNLAFARCRFNAQIAAWLHAA